MIVDSMYSAQKVGVDARLVDSSPPPQGSYPFGGIPTLTVIPMRWHHNQCRSQANVLEMIFMLLLVLNRLALFFCHHSERVRLKPLTRRLPNSHQHSAWTLHPSPPLNDVYMYLFHSKTVMFFGLTVQFKMLCYVTTRLRRIVSRRDFDDDLFSKQFFPFQALENFKLTLYRLSAGYNECHEWDQLWGSCKDARSWLY